MRMPIFQPTRSSASGASACPGCGALSRTKACPTCHSVLPSSFAATNSPMIGLMGAKSTGKTVYLTVLYQELMTTTRRRFNATIHQVDDTKKLTEVKKQAEQLFEQNMLPLATRAVGANLQGQRPMVLEWRHERPGLLGRTSIQSSVLSFYDSAGEDMQSRDVARSQQYLAASDGLIVMVDPFHFKENRAQAAARPGSILIGADNDPLTFFAVLTDFLREKEGLKKNKKIQTPLAITLTKIDAFYDQIRGDDPIRKASSVHPYFYLAENRDISQHLEVLVDSWGGDDVLDHLRLNYANVMWFGVSSLGAEPKYGTIDTDSRGVRPHRVAEPLLWLMAEQKIIDMKR